MEPLKINSMSVKVWTRSKCQAKEICESAVTDEFYSNKKLNQVCIHSAFPFPLTNFIC